jgi:hypothetical protein
VTRRNLAENRTASQQIKYGVVSIDRPHGDFHRPLADGEQTRAHVALGKNARASADRFQRDAGAEAIDVLRGQPSEQKMFAQDASHIDAAPRLPSIFLVGHHGILRLSDTLSSSRAGGRSGGFARTQDSGRFICGSVVRVTISLFQGARAFLDIEFIGVGSDRLKAA